MSITLKFYNNLSELKKCGKTLQPTMTLNGDFKDSVSLKEPVIVIESANIPVGNYCVIEAFTKSYFVSSPPKLIRKNLWEVSLKCDVLETYKVPLLKQTAVIDRCEKYYNWYQHDDMLPVETDTFTVTKKIGDMSFNNPVGVFLVINDDPD